MAVTKQLIEYQLADVVFEGVAIWDERIVEKRPGVLVAHTWHGRNDFAISQAAELASLGYTGFALDMYGKGILGRNVAENSALMRPFMDDRHLVSDRMRAALEIVSGLETVDSERIAAVGFCFGGLCVLDLARSGAELAGVVSFHGLLTRPVGTRTGVIHPKVLVLHGASDSLVPMADVTALGDELSAAGADWQMNIYSGAEHGFAVVDGHPASVADRAARRAHEAAHAFLAEVLS